MQKKYHLIAIGGSVMHNVAIDLQELGHDITGSDDEIYEPSRSRLADRGLLPDKTGWDEGRITSDIDAIILGKHAKSDNPELQRALQLNIPIYSFPEFISMNSKAEKRVCIAGSHGKTSTTSMIMHVLKYHDLEFDYLVGAQLEGFDKMVKISDADILICEGDEYPSSVLDDRAKMLHYKATISVITGMAWDHVNIYTTYDSYKQAFRDFLNTMPPEAVCFFDQSDDELNRMLQNESFPSARRSYRALFLNKRSEVELNGSKYPVKVFGRHNMLNMNAALLVCQELGINEEAFFEAIESFKGAAKRLELIHESDGLLIYRDFAHAPSKCKATVEAVRSRYPDKKITAILELHTFSSLDIRFIKEYAGSMDLADRAYVYFDKHALQMKGMPELDTNEVFKAFDNQTLKVINAPDELEVSIRKSMHDNTDILLLMSSGNVGGLQLDQIFKSEQAN